MTATCECKCKQCGLMFTARVADRKRGWAQFCSKSCKAKKQEGRTHQHRNYLREQLSQQDREYRGLPDADAEACGHIFDSGFFGHGQS